jgi:FKBP-type peptidyl-prolyl cis-trans isomerase SlyD
MKISDKKVVGIHYILKDDNGEIIDSSEGQSPLVYIQGSGNVISGLEQALINKEAGDKLHVVIKPEDAYGIRDESLVKSVPISNFQNQIDVKEGIQYRAETSDGMRVATVTKIENEIVTVDMNHPLADETLHFDVEITEVREATEEELSHGHVHNGEDHDH